VLSYKTVKIVDIRDKRLGLLHYVCMLGIFIYIIIYTIIVAKGYLSIEIPVGNARLQWRRGYNQFPIGNVSANTIPDPTPPQYLPYCGQTNAGIPLVITSNVNPSFCYTPSPGETNYIYVYENYPCFYWDEVDAVYPSTEANAIHLTTRVSDTVQQLSCDLLNYTCAYTSVGSTQTYYVADVENFTLFIDHTMKASKSGISRNGRYIPGNLVDQNGNSLNAPPGQLPWNAFPNIIGQDNQTDIIQLRTILATMPDVPVLDMQSDSDNTCSSTFRYTGVLILLLIRYDNTWTYTPSNVKYSLQFLPFGQTEYKATEVVYLNAGVANNSLGYDISNRVSRSRHGVRFVVAVSGTIGVFSFQTLLITFVSGMGLLAVATTIVDLLATSILPQRKIYSAYKYEKTVDFSDLRGKAVPTTSETTL